MTLNFEKSTKIACLRKGKLPLFSNFNEKLKKRVALVEKKRISKFFADTVFLVQVMGKTVTS